MNFIFMLMYVNLLLLKLTSRGEVFNLGLFYSMNVLVRDFVGKPFCGENATTELIPARKLKRTH